MDVQPSNADDYFLEAIIPGLLDMDTNGNITLNNTDTEDLLLELNENNDIQIKDF
jgi:hypothetical protein